MSAMMSEEARRLLNAPEYAVLATVEPDGQPQLSVVWVAREDEDVLVSTLRGRRKERNLRRNPKATVLVYPVDDPHEYLEVRGECVIENDPKGTLIHALARKYTGKDFAGDDGGLERVILRIRPHRVVHSTGN